MKKARAKFCCTHVDDYGHYQVVEFTTQYSESKEDNEFWKATPVGDLKMQIDNEQLFGFFKPGKQFYLDFTEVPE